MKLVIINPTFQKKQFCKRWKKLTEEHKDLDITLLAPAEFEWSGFGFSQNEAANNYDKYNYHIRTIRIKNNKILGWKSKDMIDIIDEIRPEVVYHIGSHNQPSLMQILDYKMNHRKDLKVYAFSMRGPVYDLEHLFKRIKQETNIIKKGLRLAFWIRQVFQVKKLNKYCDAVFCHYPDALESFRKEGFNKPIFIQTQVGVDTELFYKNLASRERIRERYHLENAYVFGSAIRFEPAKGALQVIEALPNDGNWKYLLMGSGSKENEELVRKKIRDRGFEEKVILTGFISPENMPEYWNAVDCAIHFTQSTAGWVETFSLALVQAMATKLPVIGSSSGSVPYQIGNDGIIVGEHDILGLRNQIEWMLNNKQAGEQIGEKLYYRTIKSFSIDALNRLFYQTLMNLDKGIYALEDVDMTKN